MLNSPHVQAAFFFRQLMQCNVNNGADSIFLGLCFSIWVIFKCPSYTKQTDSIFQIPIHEAIIFYSHKNSAQYK